MLVLPLRNTIAIGSAALGLSAGLIGLHAPVQAGNNGTPCEQGDYVGRYALKSLYNNKYVKATGSSKHLKATKDQQPSQNSWGSFDVFVVGGNANEGFIYALRSSKNNNRWATIQKNDKKMKMHRKECTTTTKSKLFKVEGSTNSLSFFSLKKNKYVGVKNNGKLVADYNNSNQRTLFQQIDLNGASGGSGGAGGGNSGGNNGGNNGSNPGNSLSSRHNLAGTWSSTLAGRVYVYHVTQSSNKQSLKITQYIAVGNGQVEGPNRVFKGEISAQSPNEEKFIGKWQNVCNNAEMNDSIIYRSTGTLFSEIQTTGSMPYAQRTNTRPSGIISGC